MKNLIPILAVGGLFWYFWKKDKDAGNTSSGTSSDSSGTSSGSSGKSGTSKMTAAQLSALEQIRASGKDPFKGAWK